MLGLGFLFPPILWYQKVPELFQNFSKIIKVYTKKKKIKIFPIFLFKNNNKFGERKHQLGYDKNAHAKEPIWGVRMAMLLAIQQQK
jgi:hypothetical protein